MVICNDILRTISRGFDAKERWPSSRVCEWISLHSQDPGSAERDHRPVG